MRPRSRRRSTAARSSFACLAHEPACLNVLAKSCILAGLFPWIDEVLQKPFEVGPDFTYEERLVSRVDFTRRPPFTLTYHIRPEAHWSDGVPITAQDFIFTLRAIRRHAIPEIRDLHAPIRSARAVDPRPCEWFFGRGPRAGATSSGTSSRRTRSAVRISRRSGATGSTIRGRVDHRKWPVPRRAARARPPARPPAQPPLLGTAPSLRRAARPQIRAFGYRSQR